MCRFLELCSVAELSNIFILRYQILDEDTLLSPYIQKCPMCESQRVRHICFLDVVGDPVANYKDRQKIPRIEGRSTYAIDLES